MLIDPHQFEQCFRQWIGQWLGTNQIGHVAIDGKTVRHSFDRKREHSPLHLVSAWASEQRLVIGQVAVDSKSNEITAIPALLAGLALSGGLVTIDAVGWKTSHHPGDSRTASRLCAHRERESETNTAGGGNLV